jgi:hypothetical protein
MSIAFLYFNLAILFAYSFEAMPHQALRVHTQNVASDIKPTELRFIAGNKPVTIQP